MNKRGFTLVELLAVIAILAILVIIALPNVMGMFNTAKENSFKTEVKEIFKTAQQQWIQDSMYSTDEQIYRRCSGCSGKSLNLSGRSELNYYIKLNKSGKVVEYYATDGTFQYSFNDSNGLEIEKIDGIRKIADITDTNEIVKITSTGVSGGTVSSYFDSQYCVMLWYDDNTPIEREYFPFKSGMTWADFYNYLKAGENLEGYTFTLDSVWDKNFHKHLPSEEDFNTYLNDPDSQIYYALRYKNDQVINWYTITKYGEYWETYDGFGRSLTDWDYQDPHTFINQQIKDSSQGCYTPGWG